MKIGIITQRLHTNYGGLLQNFALQKVLIDSGYDPVTIDYEPRKVSWLRQKTYDIKCLINYHVFGHEEFRPKYKLSKEESRTISQNTRRFVNENISTISPVQGIEGFRSAAINLGVQALIVGSDQVWRLEYSSGYIREMFLSFAKDMNIKRIAYAASFGTDKWGYSPEETSACCELAKKFDLITVREESGIKLCNEYLGVDATHVLDPTMLHTKETYMHLVEKNNTPKSSGNLFNYILDPSEEKSTFIDKVAKLEGLVPFSVMPKYQAENRTKTNIKNDIENCIFPGVEQWLRGFIDAEMVICDSFHGCVFSIIFNKPFWVIDNADRGNARFDSLLKMFHLENRLINSLDNVDINAPIDWCEINTILEDKRKMSIQLLIDNLKK